MVRDGASEGMEVFPGACACVVSGLEGAEERLGAMSWDIEIGKWTSALEATTSNVSPIEHHFIFCKILHEFYPLLGYRLLVSNKMFAYHVQRLS